MRLASDKNNVLMIGDTTFDIEMARNADVGAIGVSWGYHDIEQLTECWRSQAD